MLDIFKKKKGFRLTINQFTLPETGKNEYLILHEGQAALIDVWDSRQEIEHLLAESGASLKYLFITHAHSSHFGAIPKLKDMFGGAFCLHGSDAEKLQKSVDFIAPDILAKDKMTLPLGKVQIQILYTPGHTQGSICFWAKNAGALFSGSTLLKGGYGRIWGSISMSHMLFSLKRLNYTIPPDTVIYPRTGDPTTMGDESWLNCLRSH